MYAISDSLTTIISHEVGLPEEMARSRKNTLKHEVDMTWHYGDGAFLTTLRNIVTQLACVRLLQASNFGLWQLFAADAPSICEASRCSSGALLVCLCWVYSVCEKLASEE